MISMGEESGELEKMLHTANEHLEEEVNATLETLTAMIEPILLVGLGGIVGIVALAIYLPLFSMYEHM
jgi:type IV pilus assembly protein PilC